MFDTISTIDNLLTEKSIKKSVISAIYHRYIGFGRGNVEYVAHTRVSLIFQ